MTLEFCLRTLATAALLLCATGPTSFARAQSIEAPHALQRITLGNQTPEGGQGPQAVDIESSLEHARTFMRDLRYEQAIAILEPVLEAVRFDPNRLRDTYQLLIAAHVYAGNRGQAGTKEQQLWYEEARALIRECLGVTELRHTQPDPPEHYPVEMLRFFEDIRREMFGSFEIAEINPPDADVIFDGTVLQPDEDGAWREEDVPIGLHVLVIRHPDYQDKTEHIEILPATFVTRSYALKQNKGFGWYATRVALPVTVVVGVVVALVTGGKDEAPLPEPLPGTPPAPPTR